MSQTTPATKKIECFSMTGYAQARAEQDGWAVRVSVKSVNHRFLDLKLRMPEGFDLYDLRLRQIVREKIRSEEHTSELQSRLHLVCRLLLEKKKNKIRVLSVNIIYINIYKLLCLINMLTDLY